MRKIIKLPEDIVAKIAAGEVIERPSYAVKELIENSIDAKSTRIEVHLEESGLKRLTVIDNGEGMSREDLEICFLPHTTSKIQTEEHLIGIKTLGFRGEALSSIAAISQVSIKSRIKQSVGGTVIKLANAQIETINPIGMPEGTIVIVENLFSSIPVRKKFLRTEKTELRHITDTVLYFALAYPNIHFVLTHNRKELINFPQTHTHEIRVKDILGENVFSYCLPVNSENSHIKIEGYIGKPQVASRNNQKQFIYINKRFVTDRVISLAVKESFSTLIPSINTPIFTLHISLPEEIVDVNVHPRKETVTFINPQFIFDSVKHAISETLTNNNIIFNLSPFKKRETIKTAETDTFAAYLLKEKVLPWNKIKTENIKNAPVFQMHKTYIVTITKQGLLIVDQHAAHERIIFEQLHKEFILQKKKKNVLILQKPFTINLSISQSNLLEEYIDFFKNIGFEIDHFQGRNFLIRKIPLVFKGRNIESLLQDMLVELTEDLEIKTIDTKTQRMLSFIACRNAVQAGDDIAIDQCRNIMKQLQKIPHASTCPHGRPTQLILSLQQLHTLFKRT